jgi:hypothetical protein
VKDDSRAPIMAKVSHPIENASIYVFSFAYPDQVTRIEKPVFTPLTKRPDKKWATTTSGGWSLSKNS